MLDFLRKLVRFGGPSVGKNHIESRKKGDVFMPGMRVHIKSCDARTLLMHLQEEGPLSAIQLAKHFYVSPADVEMLLLPEISSGTVICLKGTYYLTAKGRVPSNQLM